MIYTISAAWPHAASEPKISHTGHLADALETALALMASGQHTTISVLTPGRVELIRLWGQSMPNGDDWP